MAPRSIPFRPKTWRVSGHRHSRPAFAFRDLNPPNTVVYTATKGAVDAVTRVLAKELGPRKIRVNAIKPGLIDTEGTHAMGVIGNDFEKQAVARTPLGRTGQPDDIAPVAVFLAKKSIYVLRTCSRLA